MACVMTAGTCYYLQKQRNNMLGPTLVSSTNDTPSNLSERRNIDSNNQRNERSEESRKHQQQQRELHAKIQKLRHQLLGDIRQSTAKRYSLLGKGGGIGLNGAQGHSMSRRVSGVQITASNTSPALAPSVEMGDDLYQQNIQMLDELIKLCMPMENERHAQGNGNNESQEIDTDDEYKELLLLNQEVTQELQKEVVKVMKETGMQPTSRLQLFDNDSNEIADKNSDVKDSTTAPSSPTHRRLSARLSSRDTLQSNHTRRCVCVCVCDFICYRVIYIYIYMSHSATVTILDVVNNTTKQIEQKDQSMKQHHRYIKDAYKDLTKSKSQKKDANTKKNKSQKKKKEATKENANTPTPKRKNTKKTVVSSRELPRMSSAGSDFTDLDVATPKLGPVNPRERNDSMEDIKANDTQHLGRTETLSYLPTMEDVTDYMTQRTDLFAKKLAMMDLVDEMNRRESDEELVEKTKTKTRKAKKKPLNYWHVSSPGNPDIPHTNAYTATAMTARSSGHNTGLVPASIRSNRFHSHNDSVRSISRTMDDLESEHSLVAADSVPEKNATHGRARSYSDTAREVTWIFQEMKTQKPTG
ncbi:hypothetical protein RFI_19335 [Reticulomyxa filosa]|uniref:Uncharacterized protein n=1 Tax=Reticulomyxa filosa TaxID=46433 RepID=X6MWX2_RETFI|nr:hypothetical protein RFI_19335 [Reticulomyxa filosa]|eukprot:ETO17967.1 hypothetical protein RFI_19335 [Reticulomyxa filosa]